MMSTPSGTATKGIGDDLKAIFRRIVEGAPSVATPPVSDPVDYAQRQADIQTKLAALDDDFEQHVDPLVDQLVGGDISLAEFRRLMLSELRYNRLAAAVIGAGGFRQLTSADRARVDAQVKDEYGYLTRWVEQLERTPKALPSAAALKARAHLYSGGGRALAEETFDKTVMKAFPNLPFYPGQLSLCGRRCACGWVWTEVDPKRGNAKVYWRLEVTRAVKENCETCLRRAARFIPLICENFQWVNMPTDLDPYIFP